MCHILEILGKRENAEEKVCKTEQPDGWQSI